ncbi:sensor histidine kinase [Streptomonospora sp. S1-112]|uniref:histidine kinase n=1 Tax=Streptomonospora mangrovi TaxID=2883123 RepID=A0A9X3NFL6_9ACTN|nr:sensor histidine kinase [Streptomonospora mangrovi]MDA0562729.1 sensor histidine kinase [Streptomonospora mangrovi]
MRSALLPTRRDTAVTLVTAAVSLSTALVVAYWLPEEDPARPLLPWGLVWTAAAVVPLLWRSRYPATVAAVSAPLSVLYYPLGFPDGCVGLAGAIALFGAAADGRRWQAWSLASAQFLVIHLWEAVAYGAPRLGPALGMLAWCLVLVGGGEMKRKHTEFRALARERADEAARTREEAVRRRISEERVQLARDVHDTVAHNISLINVQAGTALYLIESEPERAAEALATIKRTSKETLRELRATLNLLRSVEEPAPRSPAPGLDRIAELAENTRGAGLDVRVVRTGADRPLSANTQTAAYRIVQEALTNAVRHARATTVVVEVDVAGDGVRLAVTDDGTASGEFTAGNGIAGMRERAAALGGELAAGARPGGGFAVRARLPDRADPGSMTSGDDDGGARPRHPAGAAPAREERQA